MRIISFDEDDLRRTLKHVGIEMRINVDECLFSNGQCAWSADIINDFGDDHK